MKTRAFHLFLLFFLVSACIWTSPVETGLTLTPSPGVENTPTLTATAAASPNAPPTIVPGSFADFQTFATEIAKALRDKNASFFGEHASSTLWNCLGDETVGVCKGRPAGQDAQGLPLTRDWATYQLYKTADYKDLWQTAFDRGEALQLVAVANQFGDNPLMPMAEQSFQAVIAAARNGTPTPNSETRVLYFEYFERAWYLEGELVTVDHANDWLKGNCAACYDAWVAWTN
ncbi:MAG: hypothetical protein WA821_13850 [Anaerolineales bacterium]